MTKPTNYIPSGKSPILALLVGILILFLAAIPVSYLYNLLIFYVPLVYVNILVTIGFGIALGMMAKYTGKLTKIRNRRQQFMLYLLAGIAGYVCQWVAYMALITGSLSFSTYLSWFGVILFPGEVYTLLHEVSLYGSWGMFGITFTDFALWTVWALEAVLIIGIPVLLFYRIKAEPYSEMLDKWYNRYVLNYEFGRISAQNEFHSDLEVSPERAISGLGYGRADRFSEIYIYYLPGEETQYISALNVQVENMGKGKRTAQSVVHLFPVDTTSSNQLMQKFGTKKVTPFPR